LRTVGRGPDRVAPAGQGAAQSLEQERIVVRNEDLHWVISHDPDLTASAGPAESSMKSRRNTSLSVIRPGNGASLSHSAETVAPQGRRFSGGSGGPQRRGTPVAAREDDGRGPARRPVAPRPERGDGGSARVLDEQLAPGEEFVRGGGDGVVVRRGDVVHELSDVGEREVAGTDRGESVRDRGPGLDGDRLACVEGAAHGAGVLLPHADDRAVRTAGEEPGRDAGVEPVPAYRVEHGATAR